jgi:hypothetical protein
MSTEQIEQTEAAATDKMSAAIPTKPTRRDKVGNPGKQPRAPKKRAVKPKQGATKGKKPGTGKRSGTKQEQLIAMLRRPEGATVQEVVEALSWQPHTVRGAISGALRKKLGLKIDSEKIEDRGRVYRIAD